MGQASKFNRNATDQTLIDASPRRRSSENSRSSNGTTSPTPKQALAKHGYTISTWLQGSYTYATLIKPVHLGEEYDVDVGLYFE